MKQKGYSLHYTKEVIQSYQENCWKSLVASRLNVLGRSNTNDRVENLLVNIDSSSKNLNRNNFFSMIQPQREKTVMACYGLHPQ